MRWVTLYPLIEADPDRMAEGEASPPSRVVADTATVDIVSPDTITGVKSKVINSLSVVYFGDKSVVTDINPF